MKKRKISQGFTLIEIIIVIIVIAILGGVSAEIIGNASRIYSSTITKHKFLKKARSSFSKLAREITWQKKGQNFSGSNINSSSAFCDDINKLTLFHLKIILLNIGL